MKAVLPITVMRMATPTGDPGDPTTATSQPTGYVANSGDCDDTNGNVNPGATEICNGVDDNCDGNIDEGCVTYYRDADGDTYGDPGNTTTATSQPAGYVANSGDCDDTNGNVNPGATEICNGVDDNCDGNIDEGCVTYYRDADGDTYGDPGDPTTATSQPAGYVANSGDCDDTNGNVNPGATEICNGVDDNCDGNIDEGCVTYYRDADGDTYGDPGDPTTATSQPAGYVANSGDCDDTNGNVNPGATEICNEIDDNCNDEVDEGCPPPSPGIILNEDFEVWPPEGWSIINNGGDCDWESNVTSNRDNYAGGDGKCANADSDSCGIGTTMDTELRSPELDLSNLKGAELKYLSSYRYFNGNEFGHVDVSADGGTTWHNLLDWSEDHDPEGPGENVSLDLTPYVR